MPRSTSKMDTPIIGVSERRAYAFKVRIWVLITDVRKSVSFNAILLLNAILTDTVVVARNEHRARSKSSHRRIRWHCHQTLLNQDTPKSFIHTCSAPSLSVQVLGPDTLGHASPAVGSIEGDGLRADVSVSCICWLDIVLGDPVQSLSPAGVVGWVRAGVGTSWRVRLENQEVAFLAQVVVHVGPPGEVERDWDRSVVGDTARTMGLVTVNLKGKDRVVRLKGRKGERLT